MITATSAGTPSDRFLGTFRIFVSGIWLFPWRFPSVKKLARDAAGLVGAETALEQRPSEIYASYEAAGLGATDFSGVINYIRSRGEKNHV